MEICFRKKRKKAAIGFPPLFKRTSIYHFPLSAPAPPPLLPSLLSLCPPIELGNPRRPPAMASKDLPSDDPAANTETGGETVAARRKRSRRVSFADVEITSVHIFKRDEDYYDTTPPSDPNPDGPGSADAGEARPLFRDLDHSDDSRELTPSGEYGKEDGEEEEDADEVGVGRKSFLRPIGSPSPGSSTFGSATSNDGELIRVLHF